MTSGLDRSMGSAPSNTNRVLRSARVTMAEVWLAPMSRSPSQWPGTARSVTSAGRAEMCTASVTHGLPRKARRAT